MLQIVGKPHIFYASEHSEVDPQNRIMTLRSRNVRIGFVKIIIILSCLLGLSSAICNWIKLNKFLIKIFNIF